MSKEYIDKRELYQKISELEEIARKRYLDTPSDSPLYKRYMAQMNERTSFKHLVADFPAADVVEVVHGEWEFRRMTGEKSYWASCSNCGGLIWLKDSGDEPDYCDNCGAKMDRGKTNEN